MNSLPDRVQPDTLNRFFQSSEWLYVGTRYPKAARGMILRALVLSGLSPSAWGGCLMTLVRAQQDAPLTTPLAPLESAAFAPTQTRLQDLVTAMHGYAEAQQLAVDLPLSAPSFLTVFGYTQICYLADLQTIAGLCPIPEAYFTVWPTADEDFLKTLEYLDGCNTNFARHTIAVMGATANLIEQLVHQGVRRMRS